MTGGVAVTAVSRWLTRAVYDEGRARAQAARTARLAKAGWLDRVLAFWTRPLSPIARAIVTKDVKIFVRDPSQWSQVVLVGAIVVIAVASAAAMPMDFMRGPFGIYMREGLAFGSLALIGFIMSSVAARFQFTAVSLEGRAFWVVRTGPVQARELLWAKVWPSLVPMLIVGELLAVALPTVLGAGGFVLGLSIFSAAALAMGISGLAVGIGAMYPDFKADNASRVAASPSAMLFMVSGLVLVFLVVGLELIPIGTVMYLRYQELSPTPCTGWASSRRCSRWGDCVPQPRCFRFAEVRRRCGIESCPTPDFGTVRGDVSGVSPGASACARCVTAGVHRPRRAVAHGAAAGVGSVCGGDAG